MNNSNLKDKVAIITGAASGIGLTIAESLVADGCKVVIGDINAEDGQRESERLGATFVKTDLTARDDCAALVDKAVSTYGTLDILVNNAGLQKMVTIDEFPEEDWDMMIAVMLTAPFLLMKHSWAHMKAKGRGRIVNINSVHGLRGSAYKSAYVAAKHGLTGLTKTAAIEGANLGITVNSICPGFVNTPLAQSQMGDQARLNNVPIDRVVEDLLLKKQAIKEFIKQDDISDAVKFLCSDSAKCITGISLSIDAGWTVQ